MIYLAILKNISTELAVPDVLEERVSHFRNSCLFCIFFFSYFLGVAVNLISTDDFATMGELEKFYNTKIEEMPAHIADLL